MSPKTDHPQNFAFVVGVACRHFEVLERLIRTSATIYQSPVRTATTGVKFRRSL
jgi:hypothetical protein